MGNKSINTGKSIMEKAGKFFYLFDFIRASKKITPGTIALLTLNIVLPAFVMASMFISAQMNTAVSVTFAVLSSIIGAFLSLSPIGEAMAVALLRAKKPDDEINARVLPIFNMVHKAAMEMDPEISKHIDLRVIKSKKVKIYAAGRHTIIMTKAAAFLTDAELEELFIHELAYISNKDVDLVTFALSGNLVTSLFLVGYRLMLQISLIITSIAELFANDFIASISAQLANIVFTVMFSWIIKTLNGIGMLLVRRDLKASEEYARGYHQKLVYGNVSI
jgi:hypothetical protein